VITPNSKPERYSNEKKTLIITFVSLNNIDEEFDNHLNRLLSPQRSCKEGKAPAHDLMVSPFQWRVL